MALHVAINNFIEWTCKGAGHTVTGQEFSKRIWFVLETFSQDKSKLQNFIILWSCSEISLLDTSFREILIPGRKLAGVRNHSNAVKDNRIRKQMWKCGCLRLRRQTLGESVSGFQAFQRFRPQQVFCSKVNTQPTRFAFSRIREMTRTWMKHKIFEDSWPQPYSPFTNLSLKILIAGGFVLNELVAIAKQRNNKWISRTLDIPTGGRVTSGN